MYEKFEKELEAVERPTLIFHFKLSVDVALDRIERRGRVFEKTIEKEYMPIGELVSCADHLGWSDKQGSAQRYGSGCVDRPLRTSLKDEYHILYDGREDVIEIDAVEGPVDTIPGQVVEKLRENRARVSEVLEQKGFPEPWKLGDEISSWFSGPPAAQQVQ